MDELSKAVTHLLVRQKQITVGMPSKNEEAITCPKTKEDLKEIFNRAYGDDPNSYILAQVFLLDLKITFIGINCFIRFTGTHRA